MEKNIIQDLIEIYKQCNLNSEEPKCIFNEIDFFDEGWLLTCVLNCLIKIKSKDIEDKDRFGFLPFPTDRVIYSKGTLQSPFSPLSQGDGCGEGAQSTLELLLAL